MKNMKNIKSFKNHSNVDEGYKTTIFTSILTLMSFFPKISHSQDSLLGKDIGIHSQQVRKDYNNKIEDLITKIEEMYPSQFRKYPFSQLKQISQKSRLQKFDTKTLDDIEIIVNETSKHNPEIGYILSDVIWSIRNNDTISEERMLEIENSLSHEINRIQRSGRPSFFTSIIILCAFLLIPFLFLRSLWITISGRGGIPRY